MTRSNNHINKLTAVVDIHSINNKYWAYDALYCVSNPSYNKLVEDLAMDITFRDFLNFLEASVIFEYLIADSVAYKKVINSSIAEDEPPEKFKSLIDFREFS